MRCGRCGTDLIAGKSFCHTCGARSASACGSCGAALAPGYRFCPDCGTETGPAASEPAARALPESTPPDAPAGGASVPGAYGASPALAAPAAPEGEDPFERLARHIPAVLAEKLRRAGAVSGERKRATVVFCDLVGSTSIADGLDPEDYRELLEPYLELVFEEVYRYEGVVNQLSGDGLMALFGAPISHEDDAERAVRAALAIQRALADLRRRSGSELTARIGIHTGMVVTGAMGNDLKMDYTAIGDTTNLAARLQTHAAPGSILLSDTTHRSTRGRFRTRRVGPLDVKGKSKPVDAHEVLGLADALQPLSVEPAESLTPLTGRDEQLAQLHACYERSAGRLGQVVSVVGDAGSGKSRLVYEFLRRIAADSVIVFEARCSSLTRGVPNSLWVNMVQRYFGIVPGEPSGEACRKIAEGLAQLGNAERDLHPYLCAMLSLPTASDAPPAEELRAGSYQAVVELVERAAHHAPIVMVVEDLHWIDDASRETLEHAASEFRKGRAMLLVTHRPQYTPTWQEVAALTQLYLPPLSYREGVQIVRARAGGALPPELEGRLLAKGEGNPLFLEELTKTLLEEGIVVRADGRVEVTRAVEDIRIPDSVHELLEARLDRLRPEAKRVAQIASVLGRQFRRGELVELMSDEPIDVESELAELEALGVLHRKTGVDTEAYRFGESLMQEVAYGALLLRERRSLHQRVGELLEAAERELPAARLPLIAHHFARSDEHGKGVRLLLQAAAEAEALPSYGDAARLYREAWDLAEAHHSESGDGDIKTLAQVLEAASGVARVALLNGTGQGDERAAARRGIELAEQLGDGEALANVLSTYGLLVIAAGGERFAEGLALIEKAVDVARGQGRERTAARIARTLGWAYLFDGRFDDARRETERALAEIERLDGPERYSDAYMGARFFRDRVLYESDDFVAAERCLAETHALAVQVHNRTLQSGTASILAGLAFARGDYAQAESWGQRALAIAEQIDNLAAVRSVQAVKLALRAERGERAPDQAELARIVASSIRNTDAAINAHLVVEALLSAGEVEQAKRVADGAGERAGGRLRAARAALSRGLVALELGPAQWGDAEDLLGEAAELGGALGARSVSALALLGLAQLAARRRQPEALRARAEEALAVFRTLGLGRYEREAQALLAGPPAPRDAAV